MTDRRALLVVDVQNDFCEGGSLAVNGGHEVAMGIDDYVRNTDTRYNLIVFSKDHHEANSTNGGHIALPPDEPDFVDSWPPHCIQGTKGNEFHPIIATLVGELLEQSNVEALQIDSTIVVKGMGKPAYSAFEGETWPEDPEPGTDLATVLRDMAIDAIDIVGIATDHCVRASALDGLKEEFKVTVIKDLCAGVDEQRSVEALQTMADEGAVIL